MARSKAALDRVDLPGRAEAGGKFLGDRWLDPLKEYGTCPDREAWERTQLADEPWMVTLRAHHDSNDPATLPNRLAVTAAAARTVAAALQHAVDLGTFGSQAYRGSADRDLPPGELHPDNTSADDHRWRTLHDASRLARAIRGDDAREVIAGYKASAAACHELLTG